MLSKIEELRYLSPEGTRLECLSISNPTHHVPPGTRGSVSHINYALKEEIYDVNSVIAKFATTGSDGKTYMV